MLDKDGIIKRLLVSDTLANKEINCLKDLDKPGLLDYKEHIYNYVIYKFLLDDEEGIDTKDINELARQSVAKAGRLNPNEAALLDVSKHCGATSSFMTKKVLLYLSLSDALGIDLSQYNMAEIEDTDQLAELVYGKVKLQKTDYIYLDNAATAQVPESVIEETDSRIRQINANVHRGIHRKSELSTQRYEEDRIQAAEFINARPEEVVFTGGTTDGINMAARMLESCITEGDRIVVSVLEHHSNFIPWQQLARRKGAEFKVAPIDDSGYIDMDRLEELLTDNTKILAVTHCSNVLGTLQDVKRITELAHRKGILVLVDGAQGIAHVKTDVKDIDCDFYCFSGHKIGSMTGIGLLYIRGSIARKLRPVVYGGGMVKKVFDDNSVYEEAPYCFEAGTPNFVGATGLAAAIRHRNAVGEDNIIEKEKSLMILLAEQLEKVERVEILCRERNMSQRTCLSFVVKNAHAYDVAVLLDKRGIAIRSGHHCAQPLLNYLEVDNAIRVSPNYENTPEDIYCFVNALKSVIRIL